MKYSDLQIKPGEFARKWNPTNKPDSVWQSICCGLWNHMVYDSDRDSVSVGSWMFMLLVAALPVIGWIMVIVWAMTGENETRKNYFRALLAWFAVLAGLGVVIVLLGNFPQIQKQIQGWTHKA